VHSAVSNLDIGRGLTLFHQYGSNVRTIVAIAGGHIPQPCPSSGRQNCTRILDNRDISGTPRSGFLFQGRFLSIYAQTQGFGLATTCFDHPDYISPHAVVRKLNNMRSSQYSTPIPLFAAPPGGCSKIWPTLSLPTRNGLDLKIYNKAHKEYFMPAPEEIISGNSLRGIKMEFRPFYWRPRGSNYEGVDSVLRCGDDVWVLQYTVSRPRRAATKGLNEVHKNMNLKYNIRWHLVMIGATRSEAESARDLSEACASVGQDPFMRVLCNSVFSTNRSCSSFRMFST